MAFRSFGAELCLEGFGRGTSTRWSFPWLSLILLCAWWRASEGAAHTVSPLGSHPVGSKREQLASLWAKHFFRGTTQMHMMESCLLARPGSRKGGDVDNLVLGCWLFHLWILAIADYVYKDGRCALIFSFVPISRTFYIFLTDLISWNVT